MSSTHRIRYEQQRERKRSGGSHLERFVLDTNGTGSLIEVKREEGEKEVILPDGFRFFGKVLSNNSPSSPSLSSSQHLYGRGKLFYPNGDVFVGEVKEGKPYGEGVMTYSNGDKFEGHFLDGLREVLFAIIILLLLLLIIISCFLIHVTHIHYFLFFQGKGKYCGARGDEFSGEYSRGRRHGMGMYNSGKGDSYKGGFVNGKMSGRGVLELNSGVVYSGEFWEGRYHGVGSLVRLLFFIFAS